MKEPHTTNRPSLLYAIKQAELAVRSHLDDILRGSGITAVQYTALTVLRASTGLTTAQLARNSFVATQSMADIVRALERERLIDRQRDAADARRILIRLTEKGTMFLATYDQQVGDLEERMVADLTSAQREAYRKALFASRAALSRAAEH